MSFSKWFALPLAAAVSVAACSDSGSEGGDNPDGAVGTPDAPAGGAAILSRPSTSRTIAITEDDSRVVMVNPADDSISIFTTADNQRVGEPIKVGAEPSSVVISPDGKTAYVSNRADATVVKVTGIDGSSPTVGTPVGVGSEPTGVALSPTGARLYVAEFAEGRIAVLDTASMTEIGAISGSIQHPRGVAVTNNNNADDDDELIIVPEFFGEPNEADNRANLVDATKLDKSRIGRVRVYDSKTLTAQTPILFDPRPSGVTPSKQLDAANPQQSTVLANQLYMAAVQRDASGHARIFLPSVSAAPARPVVFDGNVYPMVWVGDLATRKEDTSKVGTVNLAERVLASGAAGQMAGKFFLNDIVDMDFVVAGNHETSVAYVISRGADAVQRVDFDPTDGPVLGLDKTHFQQIDLLKPGAAFFDDCKAPNGIVVRRDAAKAYVNCWVTHRMGVVSLGTSQKLDVAVESFARDKSKEAAEKGLRFVVTSRARWSGNALNFTKAGQGTLQNLGWGNCFSCHPDGLSDNLTWTFATGPRQTISLDAVFSKHGGTQKPRALNWTAIFDDIRDFEKNTREVSGGIGAVTHGGDDTVKGPSCGNVNAETRVEIIPFVDAAISELINSPANCVDDWNNILAWSKTVRPPRAPQKKLDPALVAKGREYFDVGPGGTDTATSGGCVKCHGGPAFTVSHVFYAEKTVNTDALKDPANPKFIPLNKGNFVKLFNNQTKHLEPELNDAGAPIAPPHVTCALRKLDTLGPAALEIRDNGNPAQGIFSGFNVPALYGLSMSAPYLHSGLALTLDELLDPNGSFQGHLRAGNPNFNKDGDPEITKGLIAYLLSIDADTDELAVPDGFDACPSFFSAE